MEMPPDLGRPYYAPRYRVTVSKLSSDLGIHVRGVWCMVTLAFEMKGGKVKRVKLTLLN